MDFLLVAEKFRVTLLLITRQKFWKNMIKEDGAFCHFVNKVFYDRSWNVNVELWWWLYFLTLEPWHGNFFCYDPWNFQLVFHWMNRWLLWFHHERMGAILNYIYKKPEDCTWKHQKNLIGIDYWVFSKMNWNVDWKWNGK